MYPRIKSRDWNQYLNTHAYSSINSQKVKSTQTPLDRWINQINQIPSIQWNISLIKEGSSDIDEP